MTHAPIEASLTVAAYYTREGGRFVMSCPALRLAAQGKTLLQAKREFRDLLTANLEYRTQGGHFEEVMRNALADPDPRVVPTRAKAQVITLQIPAELLAAVYGSKQKPSGGKLVSVRSGDAIRALPRPGSLTLGRSEVTRCCSSRDIRIRLRSQSTMSSHQGRSSKILPPLESASTNSRSSSDSATSASNR